MTVATLYIDPCGPYPRMSGIDCWDVVRDARKYKGPHPIVAHPPCGPWSKQRANYRGLEHDCAVRAVEQLYKFGGVLEHPAGSKLWEHMSLPLPGEEGCGCYDRFAPGHRCTRSAFYTIEVTQVEWGHVARKRTWLLLSGVPREALESPPFPGRQPTHWLSGGRTKSSRKGSPVPPGIKVCSAQQRRRTPPLFAEYLVRLAQKAKVSR